MRHRKFPFNPVSYLACACLLLCLRFAIAAEPPVSVWVSASHIGEVVYAGGPLLRVIAADLDRLHRFLPSCSQTAFPSTVTETHRRGLEDGDGEPSDTDTPTEFAPLIPHLWPSPRAPDLIASNARAPHSAPAYRSLTLVDPFLPRPPPIDTAL